MKKTNKIIIAVISGFILITGMSACSHFRDPQARADYVVEKISSKLDLNEAQALQLSQLKDEVMDLRQTLRNDRDAVLAEVDEIFAQSTLDQQRVNQLLQKKIDTVNSRAPQIINALAIFYDGLNVDQQNMIREEIQSHKDHSHHWNH